MSVAFAVLLKIVALGLIGASTFLSFIAGVLHEQKRSDSSPTTAGLLALLAALSAYLILILV